MKHLFIFSIITLALCASCSQNAEVHSVTRDVPKADEQIKPEVTEDVKPDVAKQEVKEEVKAEESKQEVKEEKSAMGITDKAGKSEEPKEAVKSADVKPEEKSNKYKENS